MQVWHESMHGPWYEHSGPSAIQVRDSVEQSFWKLWKEGKPEVNCLLIQKCIDRIIPLTRNDFGSWRGYTSFRMKDKLVTDVKRLYDNEIKKAKNTLKTKFVPHVLHQLYKPDGIMMKNTQEHFEEYNKKNILNKKK